MSCLDPVSFFLIPENIELFHGKLMFSRQALNHASIFFYIFQLKLLIIFLGTEIKQEFQSFLSSTTDRQQAMC